MGDLEKRWQKQWESVLVLQMYENGQRIPRDNIKIKLANFYGVTVQTIFFDSEQHEVC